MKGEKTISAMAAVPATHVIQVTNVAPAASLEQMKELFGYLGKIRDIRLYPSDNYIIEPQSKVCYVQYYEMWSVGVAQHLTNTVFIDRALIVVPIADDGIPSEATALALTNPNSALPGLVSSGPNPLINEISGVDGNLVITTVDPKLTALGLPQYPPLPANMDPAKIEEIRRTVYIGNLDCNVTANHLLKFINQIGEVKYIRMAGDEAQPTRFAFVEFTDQSSVAKALQYNGVLFEGRPLKINHSNNAIVKPQPKSSETAQKEIEEAMKRVREAQSLITAAIEPELADKGKKRSRRSRSRSRCRRRSTSHSRHKKRSHSRSKRSHSRRRSRSRIRSHSRRRSKTPSKRSKHKSRSRSRGKRKSTISPRRRKGKSRSQSRDHSKKHRRTRSRSRSFCRSVSKSKSWRSSKSKEESKSEKNKVNEKSPKDKTPKKAIASVKDEINSSKIPLLNEECGPVLTPEVSLETVHSQKDSEFMSYKAKVGPDHILDEVSENAQLGESTGKLFSDDQLVQGCIQAMNSVLGKEMNMTEFPISRAFKISTDESDVISGNAQLNEITKISSLEEMLESEMNYILEDKISMTDLPTYRAFKTVTDEDSCGVSGNIQLGETASKISLDVSMQASTHGMNYVLGNKIDDNDLPISRAFEISADEGGYKISGNSDMNETINRISSSDRLDPAATQVMNYTLENKININDPPFFQNFESENKSETQNCEATSKGSEAEAFNSESSEIIYFDQVKGTPIENDNVLESKYVIENERAHIRPAMLFQDTFSILEPINTNIGTEEDKSSVLSKNEYIPALDLAYQTATCVTPDFEVQDPSSIATENSRSEKAEIISFSTSDHVLQMGNVKMHPSNISEEKKEYSKSPCRGRPKGKLSRSTSESSSSPEKRSHYDRTRSRSPSKESISPCKRKSRSIGERSRSPSRKRSRSRSKISHRKSRSPSIRHRSRRTRSPSHRHRSKSITRLSKRVSSSPRDRSRSRPRKSPKRRSRSSRKKSVTPKRKSRSPCRRSRTSRRRSSTPKGRSRSPSYHRRSHSRRRSRSPVYSRSRRSRRSRSSRKQSPSLSPSESRSKNRKEVREDSLELESKRKPTVDIESSDKDSKVVRNYDEEEKGYDHTDKRNKNKDIAKPVEIILNTMEDICSRDMDLCSD